MPESKTRKKPAPRQRARPTLAANAAEAEATGGQLGFMFRGHRFIVDYATADFGRAMWAIRLAGRPGADLAAAVNQILDVLEATIGEEQAAILYKVAPDFFKTESTQREYWAAFAEMTVGAGLGEHSAS